MINLPQPYIAKNMRVEVDGHILDMIELVNLEVLHDGGIEPEYGQDVDATDHNILKPRNRHKVGMKRCRFTIRRWFKAGVETDLLYDLHNQDTVFILKEYLNNITGTFLAGLEIDNCEIYTYTAETGTSNDIIIEEAQGEGLTYGEVPISPPCPSGEQIVNGDFENGTTGWIFDSPQSSLTTSQSHSVSHSVFSYSDAVGFHQTISNIPVSCVTLITVWTKGGQALNGEYVAIVTYDDATTETTFIGGNSGWYQMTINIAGGSGKNIVDIRFKSGTSNQMYIDDVSLMC